jgi:hypothetical protein
MTENIKAILKGWRMNREAPPNADKFMVTLIFEDENQKPFEIQLDRLSSARAEPSGDGTIRLHQYGNEAARPFTEVTIPAGYVACGFSAAAGPPDGRIENNRVLLAPTSGDQENPWNDPEAVVLTMTPETLRSLTDYLADPEK